MKIIEWSVSLPSSGVVGGELRVEDEATSEEIDEYVMDAAMRLVDINWSVREVA